MIILLTLVYKKKDFASLETRRLKVGIDILFAQYISNVHELTQFYSRSRLFGQMNPLNLYLNKPTMVFLNKATSILNCEKYRAAYVSLP